MHQDNSGKGEKTWKYSIFGAVSGTTARTVTAPLERLRILVEVQGMEKVKNPHYTPKYSVRNGFGIILREEGWRGFYKGHLTNLMHVAPSAATRFYLFELSKKHLRKEEGRLPGTTVMACGAAAGIGSALLTHPVDFIRTRLMAQTPSTPDAYRYTGIINSFKSVFRQEGLLAFWKGLPASILGVAPFVSINFSSYEFIKQKIGEARGGSMPFYWGPLCGASAGMIAMTCTYPFDVLRRRMMLQGMGGQERVYYSLRDAIKKINTYEGPAGYFRGMVPNYIKVLPSVSISFGTYELCKRIWDS